VQRPGKRAITCRPGDVASRRSHDRTIRHPTSLIPRHPSYGAAQPSGFFERQDRSDDADFYAAPRFVTHIDADAVRAVQALYDELAVPDGWVLDLMASWVSHFSRRPEGGLVLLGMNAAELAANPMADEQVLRDLNYDPKLPFADSTFDAVTCCVSIDYLVRPVEVLRDVARVLRPGGVVVSVRRVWST
jgi:hypothetical protein